MFAELEDWESACQGQYQLTDILIAHHDENALAEATKCYDYAKSYENSMCLMNALQFLAYAQRDNNMPTEALSSAKDALLLAKTCECRACVPDALLVLGALYLDFKKYKKAKKYLTKARILFRQSNSVRAQLMTDTLLGKILVREDLKAGKKLLKNTFKVSEHLSTAPTLIRSGMAIANIYAQEEKREKAIKLYEQMSQVAQDSHQLRLDSQIALKLCGLYRNQADTEKLTALIERITPVFSGSDKQRQTLKYFTDQTAALH
jgi:tetratricopeptide (TPR) repeat protein